MAGCRTCFSQPCTLAARTGFVARADSGLILLPGEATFDDRTDPAHRRSGTGFCRSAIHRSSGQRWPRLPTAAYNNFRCPLNRSGFGRYQNRLMNQQNISDQTGTVPHGCRSTQRCTSLLVVNSAGRVGWSLPDPLNIRRSPPGEVAAFPPPVSLIREWLQSTPTAEIRSTSRSMNRCRMQDCALAFANSNITAMSGLDLPRDILKSPPRYYYGGTMIWGVAIPVQGSFFTRQKAVAERPRHAAPVTGPEPVQPPVNISASLQPSRDNVTCRPISKEFANSLHRHEN